MPKYMCDECDRIREFMADSQGRVLFCPECTRSFRKQIAMRRI